MICQLDNPTIDVVDYDFATLESILKTTKIFSTNSTSRTF